MIGDLAGTDPQGLSAGTPLADALTSLDRVELATLIETAYGVTLSDEAIAGERTLGELARELARRPPILARAEEEPVEQGPAEQEAASAGPDEFANWRDSPPSLRPPISPWRTWLPVRSMRFLLREGVATPLLALCVRLRVEGIEQVKALDPPFLLIANHVSLIDPVVLIAGLPRALRGRVAPAARWNFFTERRYGAFHYWAAVLGFNAIPLVQVGDWRPTLRIAGRLADRGYCPLIFPEGERSADGDPGEFHLGAALMAQSLHLPILPCATAGLHAVLPRGARWPIRSGWRRPTVAVRIGSPLPVPRPDEDLPALVRALRSRIVALHEEALAISGRR
jgi:1-acyl-sn-glycerol-3-phosphate acyltransferase/acyl carrier protein